MDGPYSSGEVHILKARKPYTITKQRERWTEEEHNRFLEALKLHGRAWQRIEEHIGTKTAVQIRSHAQKFFTKLEKEANDKGNPVGQAVDIEIPPPRPKRKPSIPYNGHPIPQGGSMNGISATLDTLDLEREPPPEVVLIPSIPESGARKSSTFTKFMLNLEEEVKSDESYVNVVTKDKHYLHKADDRCTEICCILGEGDESKLNHKVQESSSQPIHEPVHNVDAANMELDTPHVMEYHDSDKAHHKPLLGHSLTVNTRMADHESIMHAPKEPFIDNSSSAISEQPTSTSNITFNGPLPGLHPILTPIQNHDDYHTFSKLVISNLLQNPAAHAAASFAASYWPGASSCNAPPSMGAIVASTVASATAWWAANGIFPLYQPFHMGLSYGTSAASLMVRVRVPDDERRKEANNPYSEQSNVLNSSSEGLTLMDTKQNRVDTSKPEGTKQVDRSSCGSNATSGSEVDTDVKEKQKKMNKEELSDTKGTRARSSSYSVDSWKEVSEEERLAFRALFSRVTLPQSFSHSNEYNNEGKSTIDLNQQNCYANDDSNKVWFNCSSNQETEENMHGGSESNRKEDGMLISGKLKGRQTGFKPYKRCSVLEAKEGSGLCVSSSQDQEKGPKRIRLEGQALT